MLYSPAGIVGKVSISSAKDAASSGECITATAAAYHVNAKAGCVGVKGGKRLVKEVKSGVSRKRARNGHACLHTAGQLVRIVVFVSLKPQLAQQSAGKVKS